MYSLVKSCRLEMIIVNVRVGVDKMLYLTCALSAVLRTRVITETRLRHAAQHSHSSVKRHSLHLLHKLLIHVEEPLARVLHL